MQQMHVIASYSGVLVLPGCFPPSQNVQRELAKDPQRQEDTKEEGAQVQARRRDLRREMSKCMRWDL